jgi:Zn-dependent peptidase ImmA (M78 family)
MFNDYSLDFKPKMAARDLLKQLEIEVPDDIFEILKILGIEYDEVPLSEGIDGALLCESGNYGILVNSHIAYEARKRFTIGHELGHYWIPEHHDTFNRKCLNSDIGAFDNKKNIIEYEADIFSAEFLMPEELFKKYVQLLDPSLISIEKLAEKYKTSLTATALRFVEFTLEPCALILMEDKKVRWSKKSKSFKYDIKKKPTACIAYELSENGQLSMYDSLYSNLWLTSCDYDYIWEDVINFKNLNQQLIMLTVNNFKDAKRIDDYDSNYDELF